MRRFASLRRQADFARLRQRGRRVSSTNLTLFLSDAPAGASVALVGITVNKAIGKAVVRNKLRRRLAAIVHETLSPQRGLRMVVVPRPSAATLPFETLRAEVAASLGRSS